MIILNFAHPLTQSQLDQLAKLLQKPVERVIEVKCHFDTQTAFHDQLLQVLESLSLSSVEWQTLPIIINPPSLSPIACVLLSVLHGKMGYFPDTIRLRPVANASPPLYEVAEILRLNLYRESARQKR